MGSKGAIKSGELKYWGAVCASILGMVFLVAETTEDWCHVWLVAELLSMMSFLLVLHEVVVTRSVAGLSVKMFDVYVILLLSKFFTIFMYHHYLPGDEAYEHWAYRTMQVVHVVCAASISYLGRFVHPQSVEEKDADNFNTLYIYLPALAASLVFHPDVIPSYFGNVSWAFGTYCESLALLPQIVLFQMSKDVRDFTARFVTSQFVVKCLLCFFWATWVYRTGIFWFAYLFGSSLIGTIVGGDFVYEYFKALQFQLPFDL